MIKKNASKSEIKPYYYNDNISVFYEMKYGNEEIKPGDLIKFKNIRGTFKFIQLVHHRGKDVSWIDCMDKTSGEYRSFYVDKFKGMIRAKKSIRKKMNVKGT